MRLDAQIGFSRRGVFAGGTAPRERDFTPGDMWRILQRNRFLGAVACPLSDDESETDWLLEATREHPWVFGIVGNSASPHALDRWQKDPRFKGSRCGLSAGIEELERRGLACDFVGPADDARRALDIAPGLRMAVSHRECAGLDSAMVKVVLLRREPLPPISFDRILFGSGWPDCMRSGIWKETLAAFTQSIGAQTMETREMLLGGNANRFYRLGLAEEAHDGSGGDSAGAS